MRETEKKEETLDTTQENTTKELEDIVRNQLTDEQFNKYTMSWLDTEMIIEIMMDWPIETKRDAIIDLQNIIKEDKEYNN